MCIIMIIHIVGIINTSVSIIIMCLISISCMVVDEYDIMISNSSMCW